MSRVGSEFSGPEVMYPPVADGAPSRALVATPTYAPPAPAFGGYAPRGPEILYGGFNQTWLAHCLRRRWLMAILMGLLVGAVAAALLLWLFPSVSQVTAYLKVKSQTGNLVFQEQGQKLSPLEMERAAQNHLALLKSPLVLDAALQKQEIQNLDAIQNQDGEHLLWLMDELKVTFPGDGEILEVRYEGEEDAEQMEKVVAAVVDAYQDKVLFEDKAQSIATQQDLKTVLVAAKERLADRRKEFETKAESKGTLREDVEIPQLSREITMFEERIADAKDDLVNIEVYKQLAVQSARSPAAVEAMVVQELEKDPTMRMYQEQMFAYQSQLQQKLSTSRNRNSADIKRLEAQIQQGQIDAQRYRAQTEKSAREAWAKMPNEQLRAALAEHDIRFQYITANLKEYETKLQEANTKLMSLGAEDAEMEGLRMDIENENEIVASLEQQIMKWEVMREAMDRLQPGKGSDLESVTVIQQATGLPNVNTIERWSIAGIGGVAALALTCYGIALLEFRYRRLNGPTDVDEGLGLRVLGVLPPTSLKTLAGNSLVASQVAEAIDNVRATLMHDSTSAPRQAVMVTSSGSQEGSTVVASSLALSFSRAGRRTLLVDGDLRSPALHKLFGMALEDGFSEVLRSEIDLADAIRPTNNEGLYLLTAGVCSSEAIHALATDQPQAIFEKLRDQFDFIVIDAPPVLGISDSLSLGQYIDGAIITVLRDHSEIRKIHKAVELLQGMGVRVIGSVVNGVPLKADRRVVRLHQAVAQRTPRLPAKAES